MSELLTTPARSFLVDSQFTRREIDHAIGDDNICRVVRDRKVFDLAQTKFDVLITAVAAFPTGSVATVQEWSDTVGRYAPRTLNFRSVQVAPI